MTQRRREQSQTKKKRAIKVTLKSFNYLDGKRPMTEKERSFYSKTKEATGEGREGYKEEKENG